MANAWHEIIESETSFQGTSLSLSTDGSVLAVTAFTGSQEVVRIYNLVDNQWQQIGNNIVGNSGLITMGIQPASSSDGSILAIGAFWDDNVNGDNDGYVRLYRIQNNSVSQIGSDIRWRRQILVAFL